jgi:hypothetical protein
MVHSVLGFLVELVVSVKYNLYLLYIPGRGLLGGGGSGLLGGGGREGTTNFAACPVAEGNGDDGRGGFACGEAVEGFCGDNAFVG